jgi:hypothetical protein
VALRQHFAAHGYAALSYDKPGVGESTGDWTKQTFHDRAHEAIAALHFLQSRTGAGAQPTGLCGGSQAGWIMPLAAHLTDQVAFIISISGSAVTPGEQEGFRIEHQIRAAGFSEREVQYALRIYEQRLAMIRQGIAIEEILVMQNQAQHEAWFSYLDDITPDDLQFFSAIYDFDSMPFLRQLKCPFLGIWGALDIIVPVEKSLRLTRQALEAAGNTRFELKIFPQASHGMRLITQDNLNVRGTEFAPDFFESMTDWLDGL